MFEKEFILDSMYKLHYKDGVYTLKVNGQPYVTNDEALFHVRNWIENFSRSYPGYAKKKLAQYEHFIK